MPKLKFEPKEHIVGDNEEIFITAANEGEPAICIKCNDVAAFIIKQMYPEHKPRTEIIPLVVAEFGCTEEEAKDAAETVISILLKHNAPKGEAENETTEN